MRAIACIILIIGLLKFAQEAPELLKNLFSTGSDFLKGMDLNPRGQLRRQAEPAIHAAGRLGSTIAGGIGGAVAGVARARANANADYDAADNGRQTGRGRALHRGLATLGGGLRGMVRGGANGFQNASDSATPRNMYNQLLAGTEQGGNAAQQQSQRYREGNSTNMFGRMFTRAGHTITTFGNEHIVEPAQQFAQNVVNHQTGEQAAELFNQIKTNNTSAMTATGTDSALESLKNARNDMKGKITNAAAVGMSRTEMLNELGMSEQSIVDKAKELKAKGYLSAEDALTNTSGTELLELDDKKLKKIVDAIYESNKHDALSKAFSEASNERRNTISQINADTIDSFQRNISSLSEDNLRNVLKGICDTNGMKNNGVSLYDENDLTKTLNNVLTKMRSMNTVDNLSNGNNAADLMKVLDTMQSKMAAVNTDVQARQALEAVRQSRRNSSGNNSGDNSGGNS